MDTVRQNLDVSLALSELLQDPKPYRVSHGLCHRLQTGQTGPVWDFRLTPLPTHSSHHSMKLLNIDGQLSIALNDM